MPQIALCKFPHGPDFQGLGPTGYAGVVDFGNSLTAVLRSSSGTLKGAAASCVYNNDWAIGVFGEPETPLADDDDRGVSYVVSYEADPVKGWPAEQETIAEHNLARVLTGGEIPLCTQVSHIAGPPLPHSS